MMLILERSKLTTEGGGAVGIAALLSKKIGLTPDAKTVVVLSGGNVDIGLIPNLVRRHETAEGRRLIVLVKLPDRPGSFAGLLALCAETGANLIEVQHIRDGISLHPRETGIQISLEVRGREHSNEIISLAAIAGYELLEQTHLLN
jgi:threonine dehydratase